MWRESWESILKNAVEMEAEEDFGAEDEEPRLVKRGLDPSFLFLGDHWGAHPSSFLGCVGTKLLVVAEVPCRPTRSGAGPSIC